MSPPKTNLAELITELETFPNPTEGFFASSDCDHTLWQTDVAEEVFSHGVQMGALRPAALTGLQVLAKTHGQDPEGSANDLASRLFMAYLHGDFPEREICEMMACCFAGYDQRELMDFATQILRKNDLGAKLNSEAIELLAWAKTRGSTVALISASPTIIVRAAAKLVGLPHDLIVGTTPRLDGETITTQLAQPVPYGIEKKHQGDAQKGKRRWLLAMGDSAFDEPMLQAAQVAVVVNPKQDLLVRLSSHPGARQLIC